MGDASRELKYALDQGGELPSPEGEGFVLRLKPVRVGLAADCRCSLRDTLAGTLKYGNPDALEARYAESYPTFRWSFQWQDFVLVGIPDGITNRLVYEFKVAKNAYFYNVAALPIATT